jgi:hypothetical protein
MDFHADFCGILCVPILLVLACACAGPQMRAQRNAERTLALENNQRMSPEQRVPRLLKLADKFTYEEFASAKLANYAADTLKLLLQSLNSASFYTNGAQPYLSWQERVFEEMAARKIQDSGDIEDLFHKYLAARMFDRAKALRARFPSANLWKVPEIVESNDAGGGRYKVFDISDDAQTATVKYLPVGMGPKIVIAAIGGCPVTARALKYAQTDKDMLRALQANGFIVTKRFEPAGVAFMNSKTSAARLYVAYTVKDWPGFDFSRSPTFYFLKDGKILHEFVGWGDDGEAVRDFNKGMELIGLRKS